MDPREAPAREIAGKLVVATGLALRDDIERERERESRGLNLDDDETDEAPRTS